MKEGKFLDNNYKLHFFCPNCYNGIINTIKLNYECEISNDKIWMNKPYFYFERTCDECGKIMYPIDEKLYDIILRFNRLGYYTLYCCEGHFYYNFGNPKFTNFGEIPYILFCSACPGVANYDGSKVMDSEKEEVLIKAFEILTDSNIIYTTMFNYDNSGYYCFNIELLLTDTFLKFIKNHQNEEGLKRFEEEKEKFVNEINKVLNYLENLETTKEEF